MANQLKHYIYHEKQEPGSALCAQHALNSLFQQPLFTTVDLATIAQELDSREQEQAYGTAARDRPRNTNMDDTGFFSIQVLEAALQVWGLTLTRWRSPEMQPYQDKPHTQLAFILNLEEHWFTLRRFGPADPDVSKDPGVGHWFNLNSFLPEPEWVSRTYLGMVLQQAEAEGYSVFVVSQVDPSSRLALERTKADEVAISIPEIQNGGTKISTSRATSSSSTSQGAVVSGGTKNANWAAVTGMEDEDMELQAALYASVMGQAEVSSPALSGSSPPAPNSTEPLEGRQDSSEWDIRGARSAFGSTASRTSVSRPAISDALARLEVDRMEGLDTTENDSTIAGILSQSQGGASVDSSAAPPRARRRPRQEDEEEEEMIRRAIEASKKDPSAEKEEDGHDDMNLSDNEDFFLDDEDEERAIQQLLQRRAAEQATILPPIPPAQDFDPLAAGTLGSNAQHLNNRYYDDEDAELQAALRASLESAPVDFVVPPPPKPTRASTSTSSAAGPPTEVATSENVTGGVKLQKQQNLDEDEEEDEEEEEEEEVEPPKQLTAEEMRRARLARFGGGG